MKGNRYATASIICAVLSIAFALLNIFLRLGAIKLADEAAELRAVHEARQTALRAGGAPGSSRPTVGAYQPYGIAQMAGAEEVPHPSPLATPSPRGRQDKESTGGAEDARHGESEPQATQKPERSVTPEERELMAQIVYLEAGAECADGQQGVAEVILNRRDNAGFPDDIREVVFAEGQFTSAGYLELAKPVKEHYEAVDRALAGDAPVLEPDVVFFNTTPENDRVFAKIGGHYFCREYVW